MQTLSATRQSDFRYLWRWTRQSNLPSHLAATKVVVFDLSPSDVLRRLKPAIDTLASDPALQDIAGPLVLRELSSQAERDFSYLVSNHLLSLGVPEFKFMSELEPQLAIARDSVAFHHDMPLWMNVFGAWCLDGPERVLHFPMMGLSVPFKPGTFVLFDPAQPHGLLRPGKTEFEAEQCEDPENITLLNFSFSKAGVFADLLGCELVPSCAEDLMFTTDAYKPCPRTGMVELFSVEPLAAA